MNNVYQQYARFYNLLFGSVLNPGRASAVAKLACSPGDKVLEVGIGTGLSLPFYPVGAQITGIDGSPGMLRIAHNYCKQHHLGNVKLYVMDAENMAFADNSFDKVVAMYVASVVAHPDRMLQEMLRVCRPGGMLVIVNHFQNSNPFIRMIERSLAPLADHIGFRADFPVRSLVSGSDSDMEIIDSCPVNMFGYWTLLQAHNNKHATPVTGADKISLPDAHNASAA